MSRTVRAARIAALLLLALLLAVPSAASAKPKKTPCGKTKARHTNCGKKKAKPKPKPKPMPSPTTPITATLLDGSAATVTIPSVALPGGYVLPGTPATRTIPLSGALHGGIPGGYQLNQDNTLQLKTASIGLGAVDLLADPGCGGASVLRLDPGSNVTLSPASPSSATIGKDGTVKATVVVALNLAFDSRQGTACADPLVTMGNATTTYPLTVQGKVQPGIGLTQLALDTPAPIPLSVSVCLSPGAAGAPCPSPPVAYPVSIAVHAVTKIAIG